MKTFWIILFHILGIAFLLCLGFALNEKISNEYSGVIVVFSLAIGVYSTILNYLYRRSQKFYLFVNRILLMFRHTHTFWQPHFYFELKETHDPNMLEKIWVLFNAEKYTRVVKKNQTPSTLNIIIDDLFSISFRLNENSLNMSFDQRFLVPSHLYDEYRRRLSKWAESVKDKIVPTSAKYSIVVSFGDGCLNPYYGFFVNHVPHELLQSFQAAFRLTPKSDCRVEASQDHVNIEGTSLTDTFEALNRVLSLKAIPEGNMS